MRSSCKDLQDCGYHIDSNDSGRDLVLVSTNGDLLSLVLQVGKRECSVSCWSESQTLIRTMRLVIHQHPVNLDGCRDRYEDRLLHWM